MYTIDDPWLLGTSKVLLKIQNQLTFLHMGVYLLVSKGMIQEEHLDQIDYYLQMCGMISSSLLVLLQIDVVFEDSYNPRQLTWC